VHYTVIASIIASVLVIFFVQPVLSLAWKLLLSNIRFLSDLTYRHAALNMREENAFVLLLLVYSSLIGFFLGTSIYAYSSADAIRKQIAEPRMERFLRAITISSLKSKLGATTVLLIVLIAGGVSMTVRFRDIQLNASFEQRLAVLAPHVSDQEYKELVAYWAGMQSEEDYRAIVEKMESLAKARGVKLPELLSGAFVAAF